MKRCPVCQRTYTEDSLNYCLEDGSALLSESSASSDLAATLIIPEPLVTVPGKGETARPVLPRQQPFITPTPSWPPVSPLAAIPVNAARQGRGAGITSLVLAIIAFVLLGFCIIGGAAGVNVDLIGGLFLFSVLLALVGAVLGIVATSKSSKEASAQNTKAMSIVALVLNVLYLLITIIFLTLGAISSS
jgi:hypothetical protein